MKLFVTHVVTDSKEMFMDVKTNAYHTDGFHTQENFFCSKMIKVYWPIL